MHLTHGTRQAHKTKLFIYSKCSNWSGLEVHLFLKSKLRILVFVHLSRYWTFWVRYDKFTLGLSYCNKKGGCVHLCNISCILRTIHSNFIWVIVDSCNPFWSFDNSNDTSSYAIFLLPYNTNNTKPIPNSNNVFKLSKKHDKNCRFGGSIFFGLIIFKSS